MKQHRFMRGYVFATITDENVCNITEKGRVFIDELIDLYLLEMYIKVSTVYSKWILQWYSFYRPSISLIKHILKRKKVNMVKLTLWAQLNNSPSCPKLL